MSAGLPSIVISSCCQSTPFETEGHPFVVCSQSPAVLTGHGAPPSPAAGAAGAK